MTAIAIGLIVAVFFFGVTIVLLVRNTLGETEIKIDFARGKFEIKRKS
jgi:hypothetical protein